VAGAALARKNAGARRGAPEFTTLNK
jgi:hypothetical protein